MYKFLKRTRVVLSLLFLVLIVLNFLFFANRETQLFSLFLKLQFVPSLLGAITGTALFLIILIILTLLFGRVYCSTLCPLGALQDIVTRTAKIFKSKKNRRFKYANPYNWLRYSILSIVGLLFIIGITLPLAYLDPYSNFGRISNEIFSRLEQLIHNGFSYIFPETVFFRSYSVFVAGSFIFALLFFLIVVIFSAFRGRLYCNTICPVGSLLGLISKFSVFKPVVNNNCNHCMACVQKCKSQCIDIQNQSIDETRCVSCFNCMQTCKRGAISYKFSWKRSISDRSLKEDDVAKLEKINSIERRRAIIALGLMGTALAARAINFGPVLKSKPKISGIAPPGAQSIEHLKKNCTACHACIAACPNSIISPAVGEYGLDGILLPVLSYKSQFCGYECNICTQVCPNGALLPITLENKKLCQIGKANFTLKNCIVYTDRTDCGACDEHCPTKAITMVPYRDYGLYIPKLNKDICIGCGGCEYVCPASPVKAMIVHGNEVQAVAQKPTLDEQKKIKVDEFGF
ncbi:MAG: 4Fe-4S binding protein [Rikenellaceae bacterium]